MEEKVRQKTLRQKVKSKVIQDLSVSVTPGAISNNKVVPKRHLPDISGLDVEFDNFELGD